MKRIITSLSLVMLLLLSAHAVTYTDIVITPTENTLLEARPALSTLLPADFSTTVFDSKGKPTMDRVIIILTIPDGVADYEITSSIPAITGWDGSSPIIGTASVTLHRGDDVLLSYIKDGSGYVLDQLPFDPTVHSMKTIYLAEKEQTKIYITGTLTGTDASGNPKKLKAEQPEGIKMYLTPTLEPYRDAINAYLVHYVKNFINDPSGDIVKTLGADRVATYMQFDFLENTEGFFYFEGKESSKLELYLDNLDIQTKDKQLDFLGTMFCSQLTLNFLGADQLMKIQTENDIADEVKTTLGASSTEWSAIETRQDDIYATKRADYISTNGYEPDGTPDEDELQADAYIEAITELQPTALAIPYANQTTDAKNMERMVTVIGTEAMSQFSDKLSELGGGGGALGAIAMMFSELIHGTASPFAFSSLSEYTEGRAFNVNIHTKGTTTLTGGAKANFKNVNMFGMEAGGGELKELCDIFQDMVNFTSAPLAVRPSSKVGDAEDYKYTCTRMTLDDIWVDSTRTNGLLQLPVNGNDKDAPSIDIGNPNGQVVFNSGRYKLHTPVSNKVKNMFYVATMAICYRELSVTMPMNVGKITYSGIGTSIGWGRSGNKQDKYQNVIINDGTFETYSAEAWKSLDGINSVDAVANGWYQDYTDLRLPYNTSVYGGSFTNCDVYRCDAAAEQGVAPVYIINLTDITPLCIRKPYGAATLHADYVYNAAAPQPIVVDAGKEADLLFDVNGTSEKWNYGHQSLTPATDGFVYLYVPEGDCSAETTYMRNYTTALAPLGENHMSTDMITMGGNVEVKNRYQNLYDQTNAYLLYTMLDRYTREYAYVEFVGGIHRTVQKEFEDMDRDNLHKNYTDRNDKRGLIFSDVTNEDQYRIEYGIYMMMPIMSDEWMLFSPPFDVANVYIMETTTEQPKAPKGGYTDGVNGWTDDDYDAFYQRQGEADGNMAQILLTSVLPDIFSGKGSGVLKPLPEILTNMTNKDTKLTRLNHWDGSVDANGYPTIESLMKANYYLNIMLSDESNKNTWTLEKREELYGNKWAPAPATSTPTFISEQDEDCDLDENPNGCPDKEYKYIKQDGTPQDKQTCIMKRDSVYSMYFPGGANRWYNHKYLIIEGYGPQRLSGTNKQDDFASPVSNRPGLNTITMQGNTTFATHLVNGADADNPFFIAEKQVEGVYNASDPTAGTKPYYGFKEVTDGNRKILPSQVYMVSSTNKSVKAMPALKNEPSDLNNIPTLADEAVRVWTDNGIYISAIISQHISVYTLDGRTLWSGEVSGGTTQFVPADRGMYVVQGEITAVKVVN